VTPRGDVGIVEEIDDDMVRVRLMTPDNEPSWLSSWCLPNDLADGANVMPHPRSKEWRRQSALFCQAITAALRED
jgi:hypothetical protein